MRIVTTRFVGPAAAAQVYCGSGCGVPAVEPHQAARSKAGL